MHAKILLDSVGPSGSRLTTFELKYHRFVHAELMTHRVFSRNSASSRAIRGEKMLDSIQKDPALPVFWGKNQSGMQAAVELEGDALQGAQDVWNIARNEAVMSARELHRVGLHKQLANRITEPWMWITVIVSATSYTNWFRLRHHHQAQPEIAKLARLMYREYMDSKPQQLASGEWHMPMLDDRAQLVDDGHDLEDLKLISSGRIARVSYLTHDGERDPKLDMELGARLSRQNPPHMSPFEHVAQAMTRDEWNERCRALVEKSIYNFVDGELFNPMMLGNLVGWKQLRKEIDNEHGFDFDLKNLGQ